MSQIDEIRAWLAHGLLLLMQDWQLAKKVKPQKLSSCGFLGHRHRENADGCIAW
ncbi:hypothetical protein P4S64_13515 [Vibrio sp. M60_M31a]